MQLTRAQSTALVGGLVTGVVIQTIAGHYLVKKYEEMQKQNKDVREVVNSLGSIAMYQSYILQNKMVHIDDFDELVIENLHRDLMAAFDQLKKYYPGLIIEKPEDGSEEQS